MTIPAIIRANPTQATQPGSLAISIPPKNNAMNTETNTPPIMAKELPRSFLLILVPPRRRRGMIPPPTISLATQMITMISKTTAARYEGNCAMFSLVRGFWYLKII
jgi:hypothetical protein